MIYYLREETKKFYGKPVGNDREKQKVTFVTKLRVRKGEGRTRKSNRKRNNRIRRLW